MCMVLVLPVFMNAKLFVNGFFGVDDGYFGKSFERPFSPKAAP